MRVALCAKEEEQSKRLLNYADTSFPGIELVFCDDIENFSSAENTDIVIDLDSFSAKRREVLITLETTIVVINDVTGTLHNLPDNFIRINGWPTFLERKTIEAAAKNENTKEKMKPFFSAINKEISWTPDIPGFISSRVICGIINEAFFALEEGISTPAHIDLAMKNGTNYPYGPFEWAEKIGLSNIYSLLNVLSREHPRYAPCALLEKQLIKE